MDVRAAKKQDHAFRKALREEEVEPLPEIKNKKQVVIPGKIVPKLSRGPR